MANATDFRIPKLSTPEESTSQEFYSASQPADSERAVTQEDLDFELWKQELNEQNATDLDLGVEDIKVDTRRFDEAIAENTQAAIEMAVSSEYVPKAEVNMAEILRFTAQAGRALATERTIEVNNQNPAFIDSLRIKSANRWSR